MSNRIDIFPVEEEGRVRGKVERIAISGKKKSAIRNLWVGNEKRAISGGKSGG